ncbi:uncharacterized protein LOC120080357 [Benincasa hispida]|uniref:uncharacterized protein LOC120080357 n=1 Tax=Benincasa hispida TaxID=102211 RepID=UPI00190065D6|nr:uncharacterized protein LOC120080357 [Benincasa hispida]
MWRAEESYRELKQGEVEDKDSIGNVLLSAGTALLMAACLKKAVVMFLVEQWRIWVFLVLNLILVAIFFTSSPASYSENQNEEAKQKKIKNRELKEAEKTEIKEEEEIEEEEIEEEEEEEEEIGLSKEELNERVEAFIVMFKKQLISDARKGRNRSTPFSYNNNNNNTQ